MSSTVRQQIVRAGSKALPAERVRWLGLELVKSPIGSRPEASRCCARVCVTGKQNTFMYLHGVSWPLRLVAALAGHCRRGKWLCLLLASTHSLRLRSLRPVKCQYKWLTKPQITAQVRKTLEALRLTKMHRKVYRVNNQAVLGMVNRVRFCILEHMGELCCSRRCVGLSGKRNTR